VTATEVLTSVAVGAAIAVGIVGTLVPILPGLVLIWGAMVVFGLVVGFGWVGWAALAIATAIGAIGLYLNVRIPRRHAAASGLGLGGQLLAGALAVAGLFVIPVIGAPLGFALGVFLLRLRATKDRRSAWKSTRVIVGAIVKASAAQAVCGVGMGLLWLLWLASITLA
jgi:uncharacterized protein YqgC (DUF456 family)